MTKLRLLLLLAMVSLLTASLGCNKKPGPPKDINVFSCDTLEGLLRPGLLSVDKTVFAEGKGSLKISTEIPITVPLFKVSYPRVGGAKVIFRAKLRADNFGGDAYLQEIIHFPGAGQVTAQNYQEAIHGKTGWVSRETSASVRKGQHPDYIQLNLVVNGQGTVWIDDIHLVKAPEIAK